MPTEQNTSGHSEPVFDNYWETRYGAISGDLEDTTPDESYYLFSFQED